MIDVRTEPEARLEMWLLTIPGFRFFDGFGLLFVWNSIRLSLI
jgi:hypothetical protein